MLTTLKDIVSFFLIILFFSCDKQVQAPVLNPQYFIKINVDDFNEHMIFLYKLNPNLSLIDSALINNNSGFFKGEIDFPERYIIAIKDIEGSKLIIVENDSIEINLDKNDIKLSVIQGSKINDELLQFQNASKRIGDKIELLFPDLQRARLNNDANTLEKISTQIAAIEQENINFNFKYVTQHPNSFISAMILNDLSKREEIDADKISNAYQSLSKKVKQSVDSKELERYLMLQL